jgi:hypothetical protein
MKEKLKKWNWSLFVFIVVLCNLGIVSNKSVKNDEILTACLLVTVVFAVPLGLLWAYMTKE